MTGILCTTDKNINAIIFKGLHVANSRLRQIARLIENAYEERWFFSDAGVPLIWTTVISKYSSEFRHFSFCGDMNGSVVGFSGIVRAYVH